MLKLNEYRKLVDPKKEKYTDDQLQKKLDLLNTWAKIIDSEVLNDKTETDG